MEPAHESPFLSSLRSMFRSKMWGGRLIRWIANMLDCWQELGASIKLLVLRLTLRAKQLSLSRSVSSKFTRVVHQTRQRLYSELSKITRIPLQEHKESISMTQTANHDRFWNIVMCILDVWRWGGGLPDFVIYIRRMEFKWLLMTETAIGIQMAAQNGNGDTLSR